MVVTVIQQSCKQMASNIDSNSQELIHRQNMQPRQMFSQMLHRACSSCAPSVVKEQCDTLGDFSTVMKILSESAELCLLHVRLQLLVHASSSLQAAYRAGVLMVEAPLPSDS